MNIGNFPQEVVEQLKYYVYRLIDPRNGETFYVGKGQGQRVFAHVAGAKEIADHSTVDPKFERIHEIQALEMEVAHIIHRHGMSEAVAKEVEAALIDAYPGLTNKVAGSGSRDRGTQHVKEIVLEYTAEEFVVEEPLILISIGQLWRERGVYGAVRGCWKLRMDRAKQYKLVLAHVRGVVRGAYRPEQWLRATSLKDFPYEHPDSFKKPGFRKRVGFNGSEAVDVWHKYVGNRVPTRYRKKGAQAACRYLDPEKAQP